MTYVSLEEVKKMFRLLMILMLLMAINATPAKAQIEDDALQLIEQVLTELDMALRDADQARMADNRAAFEEKFPQGVYAFVVGKIDYLKSQLEISGIQITGFSYTPPLSLTVHFEYSSSSDNS